MLAFKRIKSLNQKIRALGKEYSSFIVTNGYLLNDEVVASLDELKTSLIQITLDGSKETHDSRRYLIGGGPTYDRIVENIDRLLRSSWEGKVQIRVNVDGTNQKEFVDVYRFIQKRYPDQFGKRVTVYPGFVHGEEVNPDTSCFFDSDEKGQFLEDMHRDHGINALSMFPSSVMGGCTMTKRNAYVVGPDGELYKCWNDVGVPELVIGNISSLTNWNMSLVAEGMVGASFLEDPKCQECYFFPICDGGCPKMRMLNNRDGKGRDTCSYFKNHLTALLEMHYEEKCKKQ